MKLLKKYYDLGLVFLLFLSFNLIISPLNLDEIWNYGFTSNIFNGWIPYNDFNMVITPFYPFIMSLLMHIFGNNMLFFHVENAVLMTTLYYFIKMLIGKNTVYVLPFFMWPLNASMPNYNLFALFIVVMIIFLEGKNRDKEIGLLLGLLFLTKQSIGLPFILSVLFYYHKKDQLKERILYLSIPILIFIFYLVITNSYLSFIDLCFLGLFDFNKSNHTSISIPFVLSIVFIIITLFFIKEDKRKIDYYYVLLFSSITVPIFDYYHFILFFIFFLIVFFKNHKELEKYKVLGQIYLVGILFISFIFFDFNTDIYPNTINHFEYRYLTEEEIEATTSVNKIMNKYKNVVIIGGNSYYHKLIRDEKIGYLDLVNEGNWGYNGKDKLIKKVEKVKKNTTFFVTKLENKNTSQTDQDLIAYIKNHGKKIEDTKYYELYQIKDR